MLLSKRSELGSKVKKKKKKKSLENDPKFTGGRGTLFFCLFLPRYCSWGAMEDTTALV